MQGHHGSSHASAREVGDLGREPRPMLVRISAGLVALFACLLVFGAIAEDVHEQEASVLDAVATPLLHDLSSPTLDALMRFFTDLGSTAVIVGVFVVAVVLLIWRHRRREAVFLAVAIGGSVLLDQGMKLIFGRPRPQLPWAQVIPEFSFPSGHAMNSFVFYVALALIAWRVVGRRAGLIAVVVALVLATLIGISRIYLGYHYLTDVVGGYLAGGAWVLVVSAAFVGRLWPRGSRGRAAAT